MGFLGTDVDTGSQGPACLTMHEHVVLFFANRGIGLERDLPPDRVLYGMTFMIVFVPKLTKSSSRV